MKFKFWSETLYRLGFDISPWAYGENSYEIKDDYKNSAECINDRNQLGNKNAFSTTHLYPDIKQCGRI